jgi:hypothetical protein
MTEPTDTTPTRLAPLCFVDTETTGVHPKREAWEVALIRRDYDGDDPGTYTQTEIDFFIDVDVDKADPFGLNVGGFYGRHPMGRWLASGALANVADKWPPRSVREEMELPSVAARTIARMTHGAHLVGVVPNFDAEVFSRLLRRCGLLPGWHYHLIDAEAVAVGFLAAGGGTGLECKAQPPWKSDVLSLACGVEPPSGADRHTALGDARWAMRWYDAMVGGVR